MMAVWCAAVASLLVGLMAPFHVRYSGDGLWGRFGTAPSHDRLVRGSAWPFRAVFNYEFGVGAVYAEPFGTLAHVWRYRWAMLGVWALRLRLADWPPSDGQAFHKADGMRYSCLRLTAPWRPRWSHTGVRYALWRSRRDIDNVEQLEYEAGYRDGLSCGRAVGRAEFEHDVLTSLQAARRG